jgi:hypothetical protein
LPVYEKAKVKKKYYSSSSRDNGNHLLTLVVVRTASVKLFFLNVPVLVTDCTVR